MPVVVSLCYLLSPCTDKRIIWTNTHKKGFMGWSNYSISPTIVLLAQIFLNIFLPKAWKHSIITIIYKSNKPRDDPNIYSQYFLKYLRSCCSLSKLLPDTQYGFCLAHICPQQCPSKCLDSHQAKTICSRLFLVINHAFGKSHIAKIKDSLPDTYFRIVQAKLYNTMFVV